MMPRYLLCLTLLANAAALADTRLADVQAFLERRALCDHFRAEPWPEGGAPDAHERRGFLAQQLEQHCAGSDAELAGLRLKYREDAAALRILTPFEDRIEADAE